MKLNSLSYLIRMSNPICPCLFWELFIILF
jgi:hypothetical protein